MRLRVVGPGRAGGALAGALAGVGWSEAEPVTRRDPPERLASAARAVDLLVIATPDAAVAETAAAVEPEADVVVAHLAGSLGLDVLAPHPRRAAVHPLVSLPDAEVGAARLAAGAWFAVAGDPLADRVVGDLGGRAFTVEDGDRAAYHAAACIAANHLVALMGQVGRLAPRGVPLEAYLELARGALDNVEGLGPAAALTGPAARGDDVTIARHLAALPDDERATYDAMVVEARRLAAEARGLMRRVGTVAEVRAATEEARRAGRAVGLVPTMGYLHDGHLSLMTAARAETDLVVATIFVNPLQFAEGEDLASYPRDPEGDAAAAQTAGVDLLFSPDDGEMYPEPVRTSVSVAGLSEGMEGASRPTHFAGVATVVTKLFSIVGPCRAYFGEKDFQQLAVVTKMALDLSLPVEVVGCPIVRERDGLAMSSRNDYLTPEERAAAPVLHRALMAGVASTEAGERDGATITTLVADVVEAEPLADLDYVALVDARTLEPVDTVEPGRDLRLLAAARFGIPRLLDNLALRV